MFPRMGRVAPFALVKAFVFMAAWSLVVVPGAQAAPGDFDTSFGDGGWAVTEFPHALVSDVLIQPDGAIVVVGKAGRQAALWRYLANGTPDLSFGVDGMSVAPFEGRSRFEAVVLQTDAKLVVAGLYAASRGRPVAAVARFLADGAPDPAFGNGDGLITLSVLHKSVARDVEMLTDGRILVGGDLLSHNLLGGFLARLNPDGELDLGFASAGTILSKRYFAGVAVDASGASVSAWDPLKPRRAFLVARHTVDGRPDSTFGGRGVRRYSVARPWAIPADIQIDGSGNLLLGIRVPSRPCFFYGSATAVVRLTSAGDWDTSFSEDGIARGDLCIGNASIAIQADGRVLVGGSQFSGAGSGEYYPVVVRLTDEGAPDETFGDGGKIVAIKEAAYWLFAADVAIQPDGKIVLLGWDPWGQHFDLARLLAM